jgi:hypothetical protein
MSRARRSPSLRPAVWITAGIVVVGGTLTVLAVASRSPSDGPDPVVAAAGDIACDPAGPGPTRSTCQMGATARLLVGAGLTAVLPLGDLQYENGALLKFASGYDATWGRVKPITRPTIGNHEYLSGYPGYFEYFTTAAGPYRRGYYSFDVGSWHLISLNANCGQIGGCAAGSAELRWLRRDLRAHPARCTLAYWHQPHFSSGQHGNDDGGLNPTGAFWNLLYAAGAEVVLGGHDHDYERFAPQTPTGQPDAERGIREFVVGTGGRSHYRFHDVQPNSVLRDDVHFGVLFLTLHPDGYAWRFVSTARRTIDAGTGVCH